MQRVLALIDHTWFIWLTQQLECLLSPRARLIPECFLLTLPIESGPATLAYQLLDDKLIYTQRTGVQSGVSWVEQAPLDGHVQVSILPQALLGSALMEISWGWVASGAQDYLVTNSGGRSANFALNLLPKTFKRDANSSRLGALAGLKGALFGKSLNQGDISRLAWLDPLVWRQSLHWMSYCVFAMALGFGSDLIYLGFDNWRWAHQMQLLATQSLSPASIAILNQAQANGDASNASDRVLNVFIKQVTQEQRRQSIEVDTDFAPMAAKLQQLKAVYSAQGLQKIEYDGYAMDFEFKPGSISVDHQALVKRARNLGMAVNILALIATGLNLTQAWGNVLRANTHPIKAC